MCSCCGQPETFAPKAPLRAAFRFASCSPSLHTNQRFVFGTKGQRFAALHSSPCCIPYKACHRTKSAAQKPYKVCGASSSVGRRPYWSYSVVACWGGYAAPACWCRHWHRSLAIFLLAQNPLTCHAKKATLWSQLRLLRRLPLLPPPPACRRKCRRSVLQQAENTRAAG